MNKTLLSAALIAGFGIAAFAPQTAQAAVDGTITITGKVVPQTCKVDGKANGTMDNVAVNLPLVLANALTTVGTTAGKTPFSIVITGCDASLTSTQTFFSGANIDTVSNNLKLAAASTAAGVQVQLLNASSAAMTLSGADATAQNSPAVGLTSGGATLNYFAQYISTGPITSGSVTTSVQFTMVYL